MYMEVVVVIIPSQDEHAMMPLSQAQTTISVRSPGGGVYAAEHTLGQPGDETDKDNKQLTFAVDLYFNLVM
jgi:hypothetical protein